MDSVGQQNDRHDRRAKLSASAICLSSSSSSRQTEPACLLFPRCNCIKTNKSLRRTYAKAGFFLFDQTVCVPIQKMRLVIALDGSDKRRYRLLIRLLAPLNPASYCSRSIRKLSSPGCQKGFNAVLMRLLALLFIPV